MESVWDYPRPPRVEPSPAHVVVELDGQVLADTRRSLRMLETSHPPGSTTSPPTRSAPTGCGPRPGGPTVCEFKGTARYYDAGDRSAVAWSYRSPSPGYEAIAGHFAFYPGRVDTATVDGEPVTAQPGDFYGGWITSRVTGPFKGGPGTTQW